MVGTDATQSPMACVPWVVHVFFSQMTVVQGRICDTCTSMRVRRLTPACMGRYRLVLVQLVKWYRLVGCTVDGEQACYPPTSLYKPVQACIRMNING
jgi:hypothetical protein